jgi:hypothetical protein
MYKITFELTEKEAEARAGEDPLFDYPDDVASLLDKLIEHCR